jgi:hypothetical protein
MPEEVKPMATLIIDPESVPGWGVDADPENDPTYPYRRRENDDHKADATRPPAQHSDVEILQSIEYLRRPAVFGTSTPPSGLSGMVRRGAFRWSESNWLHWLLLMGADRINVVEGIVADVSRGKVPNIPAEMGMSAEWEHNKKGLATTAGVALVATGGLVLLLGRRRKQRQRAGLSEEAGETRRVAVVSRVQPRKEPATSL